MTGLEPFIIPLLIAGTAVTAYGQYQQNKQAQSQAKSQAAFNRYNAKLKQRQAEAEEAAARFESKQQRKKSKALLSKQRALIGASGVTPEGSPLLIQEDTAAELATEAKNIRLRGQQRVSKLKSQSILDISKASAASARATGFGQAAVLSAGSTLLTGAAQVGLAQKRLDT